MNMQLRCFKEYKSELEMNFEKYLEICKEDESNAMDKQSNERSDKYFEDSLDAFRAMKKDIDETSTYEKYLEVSKKYNNDHELMKEFVHDFAIYKEILGSMKFIEYLDLI